MHVWSPRWVRSADLLHQMQRSRSLGSPTSRIFPLMHGFLDQAADQRTIRASDAMPSRRSAWSANGLPHGPGRAGYARLMQALVKTQAGPGLELIDVPEPPMTINDVRIRVHKTGICGTDLHIDVGCLGREDDPPAARRRPRVRRRGARDRQQRDRPPARGHRQRRGPRGLRQAAATAGRAAGTCARTRSGSASAATARSPSRSSCRSPTCGTTGRDRRGRGRDLRPVRQRGPHRARVPGPRRGRAGGRGRARSG